MDCDFDELRSALMDYYGTAAYAGNPAALMDMIHIEHASEAELLQAALRNGFDLSQFSE